MADVVAEVELLVQDGSVSLGAPGVVADAPERETKELTLPGDEHDRFLDGPATRRFAVVDFDPATGAPAPAPATFVPFRSNPRSGRYVAGDGDTSSAGLAINAFGTVFQTVRMFEGPDALGRRVQWAFGGEQLLIVPRAGEWANAFYDRGTRSLQFFSFDAATGARVHTALSRDVVAHECGHALLDAVVPSLYDSSTPQSVAIHEAVADLVAVLMALDSRRLREAVLARSDNSLDGESAFSSIAEEFGMARPGADGLSRRALRELRNDDTVLTLAGARPHVLSTLLSAIFYDCLSGVFAARFEAERAAVGSGGSPAAAANKALGTAQIIFRRLLLRGIDYLPPGELSFADVGRATLAADRAARPDAGAGAALLRQRERLAAQFVERGLAATAAELHSPRPADLAVAPDELRRLHDSDWAAYEYVTSHRTTMGIPDGAPFTVLPRVDSTKVVGARRDGVAPVQREMILKVAWNVTEDVGGATGRARVVPTGATVALGRDSGECLALVRSDVTASRHRTERDAFLLELEQEGLLERDDDSGVAVRGDDDAGLRNSHRLLHLAGW